jgi:hypothetical protein
MRFINSHTLNLELATTEESKLQPYVILSHTWGEDEISFQEMSSIVHLEQEHDSRQRAAYIKIQGCCEQAVKDGFDYVWIDTCCIDKKSSLEFSEAINSMYQWYQQADVCYVYLSDVDSGFDSDAFMSSRWFARGWTLQELIAPSSLIFFNKAWVDIGTKSSLQEYISRRTRIPPSLLLGLSGPGSFSVAQRMSWASDRHTTKVEDIAYCLMGIFGINMPMLYGGGERAFIRLQEEILKISSDQSIFAWECGSAANGGLLASSPAEFFESGDIIQSNLERSIGFSMTSRGISLKVPMAIKSYEGTITPTIVGKSTFLAVLDCQRRNDDSHVLAVWLTKLNGTRQHFVRTNSSILEVVKLSELNFTQNNISDVFVRQPRNQNKAPVTYNKIKYELSGFEENGFSVKNEYHAREQMPARWKKGPQIQHVMTTEAIRFAAPDGREFVVLLGRKEDYQYVDVVEPGIGCKQTFDLIKRFERESRVPADRIMWQHPEGRWHVRVIVKRKIGSSNERYLMAEITCGGNQELQGPNLSSC